MAARPQNHEMESYTGTGPVRVSDLPPVRDHEPSPVIAKLDTSGLPPERGEAPIAPSADDPGPGLLTPSVAPESPRVLSLSPTHAERGVGELSVSAKDEERVFMTPRVIDQESFDTLADTLRNMLDASQNNIQHLQQLIDRAQVMRDAPAVASNQLQDRLRLGARMLKAFQGQIDRVGSTVEAMEDRQRQFAEMEQGLDAHGQRIEDRITKTHQAYECDLEARREQLATLEQGIDEHARRIETQINQVYVTREREMGGKAAEAIAQLEAKFQQHESHFEQTRHAQDALEESLAAEAERLEQRIQGRAELALAELEQSIAKRCQEIESSEETAARIAAITQRVEQAEATAVRVTQVAETLTAALAQSDQTVEQINSTAHQAEEARKMLAEALLGGAHRVDELTQQADHVEAKVDERLRELDLIFQRRVIDLDEDFQDRFNRCGEAGRHLDAAVHTAEEAAGRVGQLDDLCGRLEQMLQRLAPWEHLLASTKNTDSGLPQPVASMIEALRIELGRDMASLSSTMRSLADRVDAIGLPMEPNDSDEDQIGPEIVTTLDATAAAVGMPENAEGA